MSSSFRLLNYGRLGGCFGDCETRVVADDAAAVLGASRDARFALTKFRPTTLPATLVTRSVLHDRLTAGAAPAADRGGRVGWRGQERAAVELGGGPAARRHRLAVMRQGGRQPGPVLDRVHRGPRGLEPGFGADAADLLAMDGAMSADVTASIANDAAKLPAGSAIMVDDFHAAATVSTSMTDLVERWPADTRPAGAGQPQRPASCGCTGCGWQVSCASFATATCISPWPKAATCWRSSASRSPPVSWRCCISEARAGPRRCRWRRCRFAAAGTRCRPRGRLISVATRSPSTSSPKFWISSRLRWPSSCSTPPSSAR